MSKLELIQKIVGSQKHEQMFGNMEDLLKDVKSIKGKWYKQFDDKKKKGKIKKNY